MKKVLIVLMVMIVLLIGGYLFYSNVDTDKILNNNTDIDIDMEKEKINTYLEGVYGNLGLMAILNSLDNYNNGGNYEIDMNTNLLGSTSAKQLFVMEQIVMDSSLVSNFVILSSEGEIIDDGIPNDMTSIAYYPLELFNDEYKKYFNSDFDIDNREISVMKNKYDNDKNYVYYNNKKLSLNGVRVLSMEVNDISLNDNVYTANIKMTYSDRAKELLNKDSSDALLKYTRSNNNIYLLSFEVTS